MAGQQVEFGWFIPTYGDGPTLTDPSSMEPPSNDLFVRVARTAEDAGFEYLLVPVAFACWEAWITTAMMVPQTTSIDMLVAARPGVIAPTMMAKMISTFDQLSGGRVRINLIAGGGVQESRADGVYLDHDDRYELMDESVMLMKQCWEESRPFDFEGRHLKVEGADIRPKPLQQPHPPFYIGGVSPPAIDLGAKHADVYLFWSNTFDQIRSDIDAVAAAAERHGRAGQIRYGLRSHVLVRDTPEEARRDAVALIADASDRMRSARQASMGNQSQADALMREVSQATAGDDYWLSDTLWAGITTIRHGAGVTIVGSREQVIDTIQGYVDLGITSFCLSGYPHDEEAARFGELVMPAFN
ncbi:MAG: LLM class flavin-dependent oxidoreductase [Actinomycetota bacterium]|jgi:alkanesulfonate monooxygenase|nr:LLM class flavin-dependent oxidoreductase [Actinomycetota bacterium]